MLVETTKPARRSTVWRKAYGLPLAHCVDLLAFRVYPPVTVRIITLSAGACHNQHGLSNLIFDNDKLAKRQGDILLSLLHDDLLTDVQHLQFLLKNQQERVNGQLGRIDSGQVIDVPHVVVKNHDAALFQRHP